MGYRQPIEDKLAGNYEKFLRYCLETDKKFVDELRAEDFIAYRTEFSVSHEEIAKLKSFICSSEEKFAEDSSDSLKNFFEIEDIELYSNIPLSDLNFNYRAINQLKKNNCLTLGQLLSHSRVDLNNMRSLGNGTVENIFLTLKEFFSSKEVKKKISKQDDTFARENIDEFLLNAVLNKDPYIDVIIDAFEKFSAPIIKNCYFKITVAKKFFNLPEEIKNKKLLPFITAYNFGGNDLLEKFSADLKVKDFSKYLEENFDSLKIDDVEKFLKWLHFDLNSKVEKIITGIFKDERELMVIYERSTGKTLQEVGKIFNITRERVRQIEAKTVKKFLKSGIKNIFVFMYALTEGKNAIVLDDLEKIIDQEYAKIIWCLIPKMDFNQSLYHYDKDLDAVIFSQNQNRKFLTAYELKKFLPEIMEENIFFETVKNLATEKKYPIEVLLEKFLQIYKKSGKIFHKHRLTLIFKCDYILKERFQSGYKIADETDYTKFLRYLKEIFADETNYSQRNIDAQISINGVLCGRGKYIHPDFVHIPLEIVKLIKNFVEESPRNVLPYKEIFIALKDKLTDTQITNHYFLQGVIKLNQSKFNCTLRKDYLTADENMNIADEFNDFVRNRGEVSIQDIKSEFISFEDVNVNLLLPRCPEIIPIGEGLYLHSSRLNLLDKDFADIEIFLRQVCDNIPVSSKNLLNLFDEKFSDFLSRNEIYNHEKLFGILRYIFKYKFYFSRPYISTSKIKNMSNKKVLLMYLEEKDSIDIEDLISICNEHEIHYVAVSYLADSLRPEFIRVDEFSLMRPESLGITDEIISAVCNEVKSAIKRGGGWQTAKTFSDFEWLPQLEISWNSFLLESIVSLSEEKIFVVKNVATETNFSSAVFVSDDFAEDNINSFLLKILIAEQEKQPFQNREELFEWLQSQGLCAKKLPKFLDTEGHITLDEYGRIFLQ